MTEPFKYVRALGAANDLPNLNADLLVKPAVPEGEHPPRILMLYGSLRERSYSRFAIEEAARILLYLGAEVRIFDPRDLPLPDQVQGDDHPAVRELRELAIWSEGMVWCSPERHGSMSSIMKAQIDHLPLSMGGVRPTQGRTLAIMQVSGGSQSFNAVNGMRVLGRWMRMVTIPNQSSIPKAFELFDEDGRLPASSFYDRVVDVMVELMEFTLLLRPHTERLTDRYSERKQAEEKRLKEATDLGQSCDEELKPHERFNKTTPLIFYISLIMTFIKLFK